MNDPLQQKFPVNPGYLLPFARLLILGGIAFAAVGCATVEPGHRGLLFDRFAGLQHEVVQPGLHWTGFLGRIDDFDVTYTTHREEIQTTSQEGLQLTLRLAVIYRPVIAELYELDTEIGPMFYEEVIGPEFRSAARGVFAHHSYMELQKINEQIENEIEQDLRRRTGGKHVEITSITLEGVGYSPEIARAIQDKLVGEQDTARQKVILDNEALRRKLELEHQAERERIKAEAELREAQRRVEVAKAQADLAKVEADSAATIRVTKARAEAEETTLLAKARAEMKHSEALALTPLMVMQKAYEALAQLGQNGATVYLGDFSHVPAFLFPKVPAFSAAFDPGKGLTSPVEKPTRK